MEKLIQSWLQKGHEHQENIVWCGATIRKRSLEVCLYGQIPFSNKGIKSIPGKMKVFNK